MELIDKAKLLAEIKRRILEDYNTGDKEKDAVAQCAIASLKYYIEDTLEVKEVDVEKESELIANSIMISVQANLYHTNVYDYEKRCYKHSDLKDAARKGIELSLKAQKGE
jgi:hypothetical protein